MMSDMVEKQTKEEEKEKYRAVMAITAWRQLEALRILSKEESESIKKKIVDTYGEKYLSPLRD